MNEKLLLSADIIKLNECDIKNGCVIAVGSFDGVHLGHRSLLRALSDEAKALDLPSAVFTFDSFDNPKSGSMLLSLPDKKLELLHGAGVDIVISAPFSLFRDLSAEDFASDFIYEALSARAVVCGYDFRFGYGRSGDSELIKKLLAPKGVKVITPPAVMFEGDPISSTLIRKNIQEGNVSSANKMLGYRFSFNGEIIHGARLGRILGFPTVNQSFPEALVKPRFGVYAVGCTVDGEKYYGISNFGVKPTVSADSVPLCETHIFNYSGDCYGKNAEISFIGFIREERRFDSVDSLKAQIERDKSVAFKIIKECCL